MAGKQFLVTKGNVLPPGTMRTLYGGHPYEIGKDVSKETADYVVEQKAGTVQEEVAASQRDAREELETRARVLGIEPEGFPNKGELAAAINEKEAEAAPSA